MKEKMRSRATRPLSSKNKFEPSLTTIRLASRIRLRIKPMGLATKRHKNHKRGYLSLPNSSWRGYGGFPSGGFRLLPDRVDCGVGGDSSPDRVRRLRIAG